ncbi:juvenile hormone acid O-methyltransferase [Ceratitis capitata]|nr:juvenile hormone acid O-methyltransferase [Ceratitis capitata]XP_020716060.1 juvenile hormone acid O-methyltransferase [Ceratitis capitata]
MNHASLYHRASAVQRRDAKQIFEEFYDVMQWRRDGGDKIIDVGSGSGNVLMENIYPLFPPNFDEVMSTDCSEKMVEFARKNYGETERAIFEVLDIACKEIPEHLNGRFDHVLSFYCLHWVQDQRLALENMNKLLRVDGGDILLAFLATNPIYDVYLTLAEREKWRCYMKDTMKFISPLHLSDDPGAEFKKLLEETGYEDIAVQIREEVFIYEGTQKVKDNIRAICPFLQFMPESKHEEFLEDITLCVDDMKLREYDSEKDDYNFITPYKLVVVYARKSVKSEKPKSCDVDEPNKQACSTL